MGNFQRDTGARGAAVLSLRRSPSAGIKFCAWRIHSLCRPIRTAPPSYAVPPETIVSLEQAGQARDFFAKVAGPRQPSKGRWSAY